MTPEFITVHCSATPPDMDIGVDEIRAMHKKRGWRDVGYHFIIRRNGEVQPGRPLDQQGAHVYGHNRDNIGVSLVGGVDSDNKAENNFTETQFDALRFLITELAGKYAIEEKNICGHRDWYGTPDKWEKECPCFDVKKYLEDWK